MPPALPETLLRQASAYPFQMTIRPRHADIDVSSCLSRRALAEYHEESRTRFMVHTFGQDFLSGKRDYRMLPVKVSYEYLQEARYPNSLTACVGVAHIGTRAFEIAMALFQENTCISLSRAVTVHVLPEGPRPLTENQRGRLAQGMLRTGPA